MSFIKSGQRGQPIFEFVFVCGAIVFFSKFVFSAKSAAFQDLVGLGGSVKYALKYRVPQSK